ncbi:5037_t:CDS:2, partial [Scutellospora calospora]
NTTHEKVAYTIAVCQIILDSKQDSLMILESIIKYKLSRNLRKLENSEEFSLFDFDKEILSLEESEISEDSEKQNILIVTYLRKVVKILKIF